MVEDEADCLDILRQIKAVHGALDKVSQLILKEHLTVCVTESFGSEDSAVQERAMLEIAGLLTLSGAG
jgi:DNA-binding FrmR family transcriptional regulator